MKAVYINKETNKEVHYGESIIFREKGTYGKGYKWTSETTLPICNETIPMLIEKGILVQKEVKEKDGSKNTQEDLSLEEKVDLLSSAVTILLKKINKIEEVICGNTDEK